MARILIISVNTLFRALLGAELIERGYEVEGVDTLEEAIERLTKAAVTPEVVVIEARGQTFAESLLPEIQKLSHQSKALVCAGPYDLEQVDFSRFGIQHIARKPLAVGELVERVLGLLKKSR